MLTREERVCAVRRKIFLPFTLDDTLTFFCPHENLEAFNHPRIQEFHRFIKEAYQPPVQEKRAVMLMLPCVKSKPYSMSAEHRLINDYLFSLGFQPVGKGDCPKELERTLSPHINPRLLNNSLLVRDDLAIHRFVLSEPLALVPYEYIYYLNGKHSLAAQYDDPGLFESRSDAVCLWRTEHTAIQNSRGYRWGDKDTLPVEAKGSRRSFFLKLQVLGRHLDRLAKN